MNSLTCWQFLTSLRHCRLPEDMENESSPKKAVDPSAPGYAIAKKIVDFLESISLSQNGSVLRSKTIFGSMVDVGCGDGRSTLLFTPYFKRVTGIDRNNAQVKVIT